MIAKMRASLMLMIIGSTTINSAVDNITGDAGTAQTGSIILSGGSSGAQFDSSTSTITESFNYLSLPLTTSTNGQIIIGSEPVLHNFGVSNQNIFVGSFAGNFTTTGGENTACGVSALNSLTSGVQNTAGGKIALINLTSGNGNTAYGAGAGSGLVTGGDNLLLGANAGSAYTGAESNNIIIGNGNPGGNGESNTIRIGTGGQQTDFFVDGVYSSSNGFDTALPVFIDADGKAATIVSSARFKQNINDIGNASAKIFELRPVAFCSKLDKKSLLQFGLIAEEVKEVMPELVVNDKDGQPLAVRYFELPVLLLNELQKMKAHIEKLEARIKKLERN